MTVRRIQNGKYLVDGRYEVNRGQEGCLYAHAVAWYWRDRETGETSGLLDTKSAAVADLARYRGDERRAHE